MKKFFINLLTMTAGCVIYSAAIGFFLGPNSLAPGGVTGISIIVDHFAGIGTGLLVLLLNIPLIIIGWYKFGFRFIISTIYVIGLSSVLISVFEYIGPLTEDLLLAGAAGGTLLGTGMAVVFKAGATTGGSDIVIKLIRLKYKHVKTGRLFLIIDSIVVTASAIAFRNINIALYAAIALVIFSVVFDMIIYGTDGARLVYIVSTKTEGIAARALKELEIGGTYIKGIGAYRNEDSKVLMCAVKKHLFPKLKDIVIYEDERAFMIVSSASEIFGEGFKQHNSAEL